jgi:uncharacterized protein
MLKQMLEEFLSIEGVSAAALISRDGFVIEIADTENTDTDALGALGSSSARYFDQFGTSLDKGRFRNLSLEYHGGTITITPLTREEYLAVITSSGASGGRISYVLAKASKRVIAAM